MRIIDVIAEADVIRPNAIDDEMKMRWLLQLEQDYVDIFGNPDYDIATINFEYVLTVPPPRDYSYVWYLCAMIDLYNHDTGLYANDMEMANAAIDDAKAWLRRNKKPAKQSNWKTMKHVLYKQVPNPLDLEVREE